MPNDQRTSIRQRMLGAVEVPMGLSSEMDKTFQDEILERLMDTPERDDEKKPLATGFPTNPCCSTPE